MTSGDLPQASVIGNGIHVDYFEDPAVFAERFVLYPEGCRVFENADSIQGYIVSHPWHFKQPPALNSLLGSIPQAADTYYIHDLALMPAVRGNGAASQIVNMIIEQARQAEFPNLSLVTVNNTQGFWRGHGFRVVEDPTLFEKLKSYDEDARFMVRDL